MKILKSISKGIPAPVKECLHRIVKARPTRARRETNVWLRRHAHGIRGDVLGIGSGPDKDQEGGFYRDYFDDCAAYITSDIRATVGCDLVLDVRSMPEIGDETYDCIFCSGVLEHVDDYGSALKEITRILKREGILLVGLPFRQSIHSAPGDYWRFTEYGARHLLHEDYDILDIACVDDSVADFPAAYWVKAQKR